MLEVCKPHTNRKAVGVWLYSAAKRASVDDNMNENNLEII